MTSDNTDSRPTVIFDLGGVLVSVDFMRACARLAAAGEAPVTEIRDAILGGADKLGFDTGRLSPQEFAERFCAAIGLRLPYSEFAEIWCDIFAEKREVTGLLDEIGKHADLMLLSNTDPLHLDYVRSRYDFLGKFGRLVVSYESGMPSRRGRYSSAQSACAPREPG